MSCIAAVTQSPVFRCSGEESDMQTAHRKLQYRPASIHTEYGGFSHIPESVRPSSCGEKRSECCEYHSEVAFCALSDTDDKSCRSLLILRSPGVRRSVLRVCGRQIAVFGMLTRPWLNKIPLQQFAKNRAFRMTDDCASQDSFPASASGTLSLIYGE